MQQLRSHVSRISGVMYWRRNEVVLRSSLGAGLLALLSTHAWATLQEHSSVAGLGHFKWKVR